MTAFVIDAFEYSRLREHREGDVEVRKFARLSEDLADQSGSIHWSLRGGTDSIEHPQLKLSISGDVQLKCQRCLSSFSFKIGSESVLILAKDEAKADELDALMDDDSIDVIVGSRTLDVMELIEDEALLTIPQSPKHETCPDQAMLSALNEAKKSSPFAELKKIRQ